MTEIISVRFKAGGKQYYFDPNGVQVNGGDGVIVETGKGQEYGVCAQGNTTVDDETVVQPLRPLIRVATEEDKDQVRRNHEKEKEALVICQQLVEEHGLDMKLVQAEYSFDGSKVIFFFTSEGRVDFRALVRDLASVFRVRIELRQIGVRDEARMVGGLGICGKPFCCCQFLDEFQPVSIKMAKTQNLSLNPTKISGTCGRLMCCLKYEQEAYEDAVKRCPRQESFVECPDGVGTVSSVNLLKEQVKVRLEDSSDPPCSYRTSEIRVVRSGRGKRPEGYVAPPKEELEKLRCIPPEEERKEDGLTAMLRQYLDEQEAERQGRDESSGRGRRKGRGGRKEDQSGQQRGKAAQEKSFAAPKGEWQPGGSKPYRHHPRHRGGKKPGQQGRDPAAE